MFTTEELYALLGKKDAETIAKEFTDALNAALDKKENERKAKEEAERKVKEAAAKKIADTKLMCDHISNYIKVYYPNFPIDTVKVDYETLVEAFDHVFNDKQIISEIKNLMRIYDTLGGISAANKIPTVDTAKITANDKAKITFDDGAITSATDPIITFLAANKLL